MTLEIVMIFVVGGGVVVTGFGVITLWVKNGRNAAKRDGALGANLQNILLGQTEMKKDISHIIDNVHKQAVHCSGVVSGFQRRLENIEKD